MNYLQLLTLRTLLDAVFALVRFYCALYSIDTDIQKTSKQMRAGFAQIMAGQQKQGRPNIPGFKESDIYNTKKRISKL